MSILLKAAQKAMDESGLRSIEIARRLELPESRVCEIRKATDMRGTNRLEQILKEFAPRKYRALKK